MRPGRRRRPRALRAALALKRSPRTGRGSGISRRMNDVPSSAELDALRLSLEVAGAQRRLQPAAGGVLVAWILTRRALPGPDTVRCVCASALVAARRVAVGYVLLILFGARGPIGAWLAAISASNGVHHRGRSARHAVMTFR